ncbi:MAG: family 43 glycosylhydrolase [Oscillospiraceae bacterium]|nr:family 43 glycosylhydrolase [Oscillospiraceae bacterium]
MKKTLELVLALVLSVSLAACGGNDPTVSGSEDTAGGQEVGSADGADRETVPVEIAKSQGGNPITGFDNEGNLTYGGDPSALVVDDTLYLYVGHDTATGDAYVIPEYLCYSTKDMVNWNYEGVVLKMTDVSWADKNSAWAGQAARHYDETAGKDMYYLYFCSWDSTDSGKQSIGVAVSDSPTGPFEDIGEPVVKGSFTSDETSAWNDIDPTVWIEEDENGEEHRYLAWGNSKLYICELNEDMISVKDYDGDGQITFRTDVRSKTLPDSFTEAPWIYRRQDENGKYYGDYYLFYAYGWREQMAYATTGDLMEGRLYFQDTIMKPSATSNTNHMAVVDFLGKTWFIYHNGSLPGGSGFRRVACAAEVSFYPDGAVAYIEETAAGVSGTVSTITALNGETLAHEWFNNAASDDMYPYTDIALGSGLDRITELDEQWEIVAGKADPGDVYTVSIESNNKAGLYVTVRDGDVVLCQDFDGRMAQSQTFRTVEGLAGEGVSFESLSEPGMYLTLSGGKASLTAGEDADSVSFMILEAESRK